MIAACNPARHLHINKTRSHPISAHNLPHHRLQGHAAHWGGDAQLIERAIQAVKVGHFVDEAAVVNQDHFIDTIGKLIAAIFNMN